MPYRRFNRLLWPALVAICLAGPARAATVASFSGGDPGEGLDLQGNFAYAINIGTPGAAGKVGDADFTADTATGVTVTAGNEIGGWITMAMGDTENDARIGFVLNSIRWSAAPDVVTIKLKVEKDIDYKLQLLFSESCCANRGFNVVVDGVTQVTNFLPAAIQAGEGDFAENKTKFGAVVTHEFKTTSDTLVIVLDGPSADSEEIGDRNAIVNGLTLERLSPVTDVDNDGLRDDWESKYFTGLDAKPGDDPDGDGLTNLEDQTVGTDPTKADTDLDGLKDGDEIRVVKSDPIKRDTDGDGLGDGQEVQQLQTDPTKVDTDGDGTSDPRELSLGTDPANQDSKPLLTTIGVVTGGDPGEGLDLDGTFVYALAAGAGDGGNVTVRDAIFTPIVEADVTGATLLAGNTAANWYPVVYGTTDNDVNLAAATSSIRWSAADSATQPEVALTLEDLEIGAEYKIQMLFGENCCNRGFDVFVDDRLVAKDFNPGTVHGGIGNRKQAALITRLHFARDTKVVLRFDGRGATPDFGDHNAILNAVTVEKVAGKLDSDNDSLPDEWEKLYFGNLTQTGTGNTDGDGSSHADEYAAGTDPRVADTDRDGISDSDEKAAGTSPVAVDSDGDGLRDGDEIKTHKTSPTKPDTDGDGLRDGAEVQTHKTDPLNPDTDGDTASDGKEIGAGTDPLKAERATVFSNVEVKSFSGGDPGEGLDLQGRFLYAFNVSSAGAAGKAGDADFTSDSAPGIKVTAANDIPAWDTPEYGDSPADDVIEKVTQSIRYGTTWKVELSGLVPGSKYKLQLLFYEQCCGGRGFNVYADGVLLAEAFLPAEVQGGVNNTAAGAVVSAEFTTYLEKLTVIGDGPAGKAAAPDLINDTNATLDGGTLEILSEAPVTTPPTLTAVRNTGNLVITFQGTLQQADAVSGPFTDVAGTGTITVPTSAAAKYYRAVRR